MPEDPVPMHPILRSPGRSNIALARIDVERSRPVPGRYRGWGAFSSIHAAFPSFIFTDHVGKIIDIAGGKRQNRYFDPTITPLVLSCLLKERSGQSNTIL
jgi:hypothetical protein